MHNLSNSSDVYCGLSEAEYLERERLLRLQKIRTRWFSKQEFARLKELSCKMFACAGWVDRE